MCRAPCVVRLCAESRRLSRDARACGGGAQVRRARVGAGHNERRSHTPLSHTRCLRQHPVARRDDDDDNDDATLNRRKSHAPHVPLVRGPAAVSPWSRSGPPSPSLSRQLMMMTDDDDAHAYCAQARVPPRAMGAARTPYGRAAARACRVPRRGAGGGPPSPVRRTRARQDGGRRGRGRGRDHAYGDGDGTAPGPRRAAVPSRARLRREQGDGDAAPRPGVEEAVRGRHLATPDFPALTKLMATGVLYRAGFDKGGASCSCRGSTSSSRARSRTSTSCPATGTATCSS